MREHIFKEIPKNTNELHAYRCKICNMIMVGYENEEIMFYKFDGKAFEYGTKITCEEYEKESNLEIIKDIIE
jgi:hypothetical protein